MSFQIFFFNRNLDQFLYLIQRSSVRSGIQYQYVANPVQGHSVGGIGGEQDNQVKVVGDLVYTEMEAPLGNFQRQHGTQTKRPEIQEHSDSVEIGVLYMQRTETKHPETKEHSNSVNIGESCICREPKPSVQRCRNTQTLLRLGVLYMQVFIMTYPRLRVSRLVGERRGEHLHPGDQGCR